eukprot:Em0003g514a
MPSRNQKKRSKQRAEYLQKREDILSQENKAKARARYKADPEKKKASVRDTYKADPEKKASVRDTYKADPEKKKASVRDTYKADPEKKKAYVRDTYKADPEKKKASVRDTYNANAVSKRAAKRQRYQEGVEENRAAKRQRYQEGVEENRAAKRQRYQECVEENRAAKRQRYQEGVEENRAAKRQRYQEGVEENRAAKRQRYQEGVEENRAANRRIYRGNSATIKAARRSRYWKGRRTSTTTTQSYSLFEPNSRTLAEYGVGLKKAILRDTQKVVTRSARAAVSKISADALLAKALSVRRSQAGSLLKTIRKVNAKKLQESDILVGHRFHTAGAEPYFFDNSYTHKKQHGAIPVDLTGRCVVAEEIKDRDKVTMRPLKWKCTNECCKLTSEEVAIVLKTNSLFQESIEDLRAGLDALDSGCGHVHYDVTLKSHSGFIEQLGHPIYCELPECSSPLRIIRAAMPHFPALRTFTRLLYKARKCHMTILAIDSALASGNIEELIPFMGMKDILSDLFSEDGVEHAVVSEDHSSSGLGCIERDLKVTHADLIAELHHPEKKKASVRDSYNADIESKQSAKRQRYQEDVEENRAAKRQKYEDNLDAIKASERNRYWNDPAVRLAKRAAERKRFRMGHRTTTTTQSYSLYEPKSHALMEYNGGLEKAILRDSELLSEVNDAFCKSHPLLAQKVVTRSACAAMQCCPPYRPPPAVAAALPPPPPPAAESCPHRQKQQSYPRGSGIAGVTELPLPPKDYNQQQRCPAYTSSSSAPTSSSSRAAPTVTSSSSRAAATSRGRSIATCTSPTTGTSSIDTSAPTTTSPAAPLAAATTTHMAPMARTRPPRP